MGVPGDGAVGLVVVFQALDVIIVVQVCLQLGGEAVVRRVADAEHRHAVAAEPFAEVPVSLREVGGDENEVHAIGS